MTKGVVDLGIPAPQSCLLFRLPLEIRRIIYQHVYGPSLIHVESLGERLGHVRCVGWESEDGCNECGHYLRVHGCDYVRIDKVHCPNDQLSGLISTCRRVYVLKRATILKCRELSTVSRCPNREHTATKRLFLKCFQSLCTL